MRSITTLKKLAFVFFCILPIYASIFFALQKLTESILWLHLFSAVGAIISAYAAYYVLKKSTAKSIEKTESALKETQKKLEASESGLNEVLSQISDVYCKIIDRKIEFISESATALLGYSPNELIGQSFQTLLLYKDENETIRQKLIDHKYLRNIPLALLSKDGKVIPVLINATAIFDSNGDYLGVHGIITDISLIKELRKRIDETESRFRKLYNDTPALLLNITPDARIVNVSGYWMKRLGYERDEVIGRNFVEFLTQESKEISINNVIPKFLEKGFCDNIQCQMVAKNGEVLDILLSGIAIYNDKGDLIESNVCLIDITDRVRMGEELSLSEEFHNVLADTLNMVSIEYELDSMSMRVRGGNLKELIGYSPKKFNSLDEFMELVHPGDVSRITKLSTPDYSKDYFDLELRMLNAENNYVWVNSIGRLHRSDDGSLSRISNILYSIDDRKRTERELLNTQILVRDRERKRISKELHDNLGQILTVASINLNALKEGAKTLDERDQNILKGTHELLRQAQQETRQVSHDLMPSSLVDFGLVASFEADLERFRESSDIEFSFFQNIEEERFGFEIETNVYSILRETMVNILKHSKAQKADVRLDKKENALEITIKDDGIGLPANSMKTKGIGLTNIEDRVLSINGTIVIKSINGLIISIQIPIDQSEAGKESKEEVNDFTNN